MAMVPCCAIHKCQLQCLSLFPSSLMMMLRNGHAMSLSRPLQRAEDQTNRRRKLQVRLAREQVHGNLHSPLKRIQRLTMSRDPRSRFSMRHHHLRLTKGQNLLFVGQSDQGPIQPEFASLQKQKIAVPTSMLNHLVGHQYRWPKPKKELPKKDNIT